MTLYTITVIALIFLIYYYTFPSISKAISQRIKINKLESMLDKYQNVTIDIINIETRIFIIVYILISCERRGIYCNMPMYIKDDNGVNRINKDAFYDNAPDEEVKTAISIAKDLCLKNVKEALNEFGEETQNAVYNAFCEKFQNIYIIDVTIGEILSDEDIDRKCNTIEKNVKFTKKDWKSATNNIYKI